MMQHAYDVIDSVDKKWVIKNLPEYHVSAPITYVHFTSPWNNWNRYFHPHVIDEETMAQRV